MGLSATRIIVRSRGGVSLASELVNECLLCVAVGKIQRMQVGFGE